MSRRLAHNAAVALAAAACALAATGCGGDGASDEERAAEQRAVARWQAGVPRWRSDMRAALDQISLMLSNGPTVNRLHEGNARAVAQLGRFEERLEDCAAQIGRLGVAPGALEPVRAEAMRTCRSLAKGAALVRQGVESWQAGRRGVEINRANVALGNGQRGLERVRTRLRTALAD